MPMSEFKIRKEDQPNEDSLGFLDNNTLKYSDVEGSHSKSILAQNVLKSVEESKLCLYVYIT